MLSQKRSEVIQSLDGTINIDLQQLSQFCYQIACRSEIVAGQDKIGQTGQVVLSGRVTNPTGAPDAGVVLGDIMGLIANVEINFWTVGVCTAVDQG